MDLRNFYRRNWFAIIYFNFKMLPLRQAIKFPFDFYGKIKFKSLEGEVVINSNNISRGCFQFGRAESEIFQHSPIIFSLKGRIIFNGSFSIGSGSLIEINKGATLEIGEDVLIAPRYKIISKKYIKIGSHVRASWEGQMFDSNCHYIRNINTGDIANINKEVVIGNNIWIGNRVTINKGTKLPDYTIVASNSLCNKDFTKDNKKYITIAGTPAKIVAEGYERIFESVEPELANKLFENEK